MWNQLKVNGKFVLIAVLAIHYQREIKHVLPNAVSFPVLVALFWKLGSVRSEYYNTRPLVRDEGILLLDKLIFKSLVWMDKLKVWTNINI